MHRRTAQFRGEQQLAPASYKSKNELMVQRQDSPDVLLQIQSDDVFYCDSMVAVLPGESLHCKIEFPSPSVNCENNDHLFSPTYFEGIVDVVRVSLSSKGFRLACRIPKSNADDSSAFQDEPLALSVGA